MENNNRIAELYMDGTLAKEIEHMLVMRLHSLNTILEVETLKQEIHKLMMDMYIEAQKREYDNKG